MTKHSIQEFQLIFKVRFGGAATTAQRKDVQQLPAINALTSTPSNRDVRVHDNLPKDDICNAFPYLSERGYHGC